MRIRRRQLVAQPEAAHAVVRGQRVRVDPHGLAGELAVGQRVRPAPDRPQRDARVRPLHAPIRLWPHTRTTLPLTPAEPGEANHATVSATSTGRPPCASEFIRRPASRVPIGIAAVIWVSMKPGATALIVAWRLASSPASSSTIPITPALLVA